MPKEGSLAKGAKPNALRRNAACEKCRVRKLRCDAARPICNTCLKSYNYSIQHLTPDQIPPGGPPHCVYLFPASAPSSVQPAVQHFSASVSAPVQTSSIDSSPSEIDPNVASRVSFLEDRLKSLEQLLMLQPNQSAPYAPPLQNPPPDKSRAGSSGALENLEPLNVKDDIVNELLLLHSHPAPTDASSSTSFLSIHPSSSSTTSLACDPSLLTAPTTHETHLHQPLKLLSATSFSPTGLFSPSTSQGEDISHLRRPINSNTAPNSIFSSFDGDGIADERSHVFATAAADFGIGIDELSQDLLFEGWPRYLPSPENMELILRTFFQNQPFAKVLFNETRLIFRISLPSSHRDFPHPAVLHAICASSARFLPIPATPPTDQSFKPPPNKWEYGSDRIGKTSFNRDFFQPEENLMDVLLNESSEDFGARHTRLSTLYTQQSLHFASDWFSLAQATLVLSYSHHQSNMGLKAYTDIGLAARLCGPLGVLLEPGQTKEDGSRMSYMAPPENHIDIVERQNLLWLLLSQDTVISLRSGWSSSFVDDDIVVGLPVSPATFTQTPPEPTQYLYTSNIFNTHPPEHRTSFSVSIKAMLLLRRVVQLTRRVRHRRMGDPRGTPEFLYLEGLLASFTRNFPASLKNVLQSTAGRKSVDCELALAHSIPYLAIILLHERYADVGDDFDLSSPKLLAAVRMLLTQLYTLSATSFDFSQFYLLQAFCWFSAATTLVKFVRAAEARRDKISSQAHRDEITIFRLAISQVAQRFPLGVLYLDQLDNRTADLPGC